MERNFMKINSVNFSKSCSSSVISLNTDSNCLIIYCIEGNINLNIKNINYVLEQNCYFIIPPKSSVVKEEIGKSFILDIAYSDYIQAFFMNKFSDEDKNILFFTKALYETTFKQLKYKKEYIISCQNLIMLGITKNSSLSSGENNHSRINDIIDFLERNYYHHLNFEIVSKNFGYSYSNLRRLFKEETGYSMKKYVTELRLVEASKLLTDTNLSISAIAEKLCFSGTKYFTQVFQAKYELTPKEYRIKKRNTKNG